MRKRGLTLGIITVMMASLMAGCGNNTTTTTDAAADNTVAAQSAEDNTVYGKITSVSDDSIIIDVGTMAQNNPEDSTGDQKGGMSFDLDYTGEEQTLTLSDSVTYDSMAMGLGMPGGQAPGGDGQAPSGDQQTPPEKPDGSTENGEQMTPPSDGQAPSGDQQTPPEKPDGSTQDGGQMTPPSDGQAPSGDKQTPPSDKGNKQEIALTDLAEGDIISVSTDADGNVTEVTLIMDADASGAPAK